MLAALLAVLALSGGASICSAENTEEHQTIKEPQTIKDSQTMTKLEEKVQNQQKPESTNNTETEESRLWSKPLENGSDIVFYFDEAITGKKLKKGTYDLLRGVDRVTIEEHKIVLHRSDDEELHFAADSEHGAKFFNDWQKAKTSVEEKFGPAGKEFLDSVKSVHIDGDRIQVMRKGSDDNTVNMGQRKLHHAFDLRGLRLRHLGMTLDTSGEHPMLTDIEGVTAVINAPGFSFPVDVKEFGKIRREKLNDFTVGVRNPVPGPLRAMLFLPAVLSFHFSLERKE